MLPCSSNGSQNLACVDQGKKIYVCDVLKKIAAIKLTIFQMGTGGPLGQKRHN